MRKIEREGDGRGNPADPPVLVIRVEGTSPKKKPKRRWLRAMLAMVFIVGVSAALAAALNSANSPSGLPPCNEFDDAGAVPCDHFWLAPAEPREGGNA